MEIRAKFKRANGHWTRGRLLPHPVKQNKQATVFMALHQGSFKKIANSSILNINWARGSRLLRLDVLSSTMVLTSPNFSSMQNPQFKKPVTLTFSNGKIIYMAQKCNQTHQLVQKQHCDHEYIKKNAKGCLIHAMRFENF